MRTAFVTFAAVAGLATAAVAQQQPAGAGATPPSQAPAATPQASPPTAPPANAPATPSAAAQTPAEAGQVAPNAPAGSQPGERQTAVTAAENPTLPTSGDGAELIQVIDQICVPAVRGGDLDALAKSHGFKKRKGAWVRGLSSGKDYTVTLQPQGSNKNVCQADVNYAIGQEKPIVNALNVWAFLHKPQMPLQRNDFVVQGAVKRITLSWEYYTDKVSTGLVFVQLKNADGSPMSAKYDSGTLLYSERTF